MVMGRRGLMVLLSAACMAHSALAQINPFSRSRGTPLTGEDMAALQDATNRLLDNPQLAPGITEQWSNPKSGASGTLTAGYPVNGNGLSCRVIRYQNSVPGPTPQRDTRLTWCKTKEGWKLGD